MSDTPRTDARTFHILSDLQSGTRKVVDVDVAQELERELAARWISVRERLPDQQGGDVLVSHILGDHPRCPRTVDVAAYLNGKWIFPWDRDDRNPPPDWVTHWMPVPPPPSQDTPE